jgi:hypothetical protein
MHALVLYRQRTVPGYLVPQFNSNVKITERGKQKPAVNKAPQNAAKPAPPANATEARTPVVKATSVEPVR